MRKIIALLVFIFIVPVQVLAEKTPDGRPILYCPDHVECSETGNVDSCKVSDDEYGVWGKASLYNTHIKVSQAKYRFLKVQSYYDYEGGPTICDYIYMKSSQIEQHIFVLPSSNPTVLLLTLNANLDAQINLWYVISSVAECNSLETKECPLIETPMLRVSSGFTFHHKGLNPSYGVSYDRLLNVCGANSSCVLSIVGQYNQSYGTVTIDLTYPEKIRITELSRPFIQKKPFNYILYSP